MEKTTYEQLDRIEEEKKQILDDVFDLYGMASGVHSKLSGMSRDYTLARYNTEIINGKFAKFIRAQRKIVRILESYMIPPKHKLEKNRYSKRYQEDIIEAAKKNFQTIRKLLLGEIDEMVIISRAGRGEVINSMLAHGKGKDELQEMEEAIRKGNIMERLKERGKKE